jgi:hypothetical protein
MVGPNPDVGFGDLPFHISPLSVTACEEALTDPPPRYNGPGAQQVNVRFNRDWNSILPTSYKYIVVIVDGRGTGFKGRKLRNPVRNNLGFFETRDQINAAK